MQDYQHHNLFPECDEPDDVRLRTESDDEAEGYESPDEDEPDPFDAAARAREEEERLCYDEELPRDGKPPTSAKCEAVRNVLNCIKHQRVDGRAFTLGSFLEALCWGDAACTADMQLNGTRRAFLQSPEFERLLRIWWKPPRPKKSHRTRADGGRKALQEFALNAMLQVVCEELESLDPILRASKGSLTREELTRIQLDELRAKMKELAPTLWSFLDYAAYSQEQRKVNKHKDPSNIVMLMITSLLYTRTHHCNLLQRVLAIYFKFKGLSAKGCDTLHALGVTMSSKWTTDAVSDLSEEAMNEVVAIVEDHPLVLSHDNLQMSFRIFSQRLEAQGQFGSGTAATVYVKNNAPLKNPALNRALQQTRAAGMRNPLTALDISDLGDASYPQIEARMVHHVLTVLLGSSEFDVSTYEHKESPFLRPPPAVELLACGEDTTTRQFMLGTLPIPEASYEDNDRVITKLLEQLRIKTEAEKRRLSMEDIIFWIGDQLTVDRLRGLWRMLSQEVNSWDRLDFILPIFGWLHLQMAFAKSLHKQYLASETGVGLLSHGFATLERRGLDKASTKGLFHDNLERALYHILEAHIRACWLSLPGVKKLEDLRNCDPLTLQQLASHLVAEHASPSAIDRLSGDPAREQTMMFIKDTLMYIVLDQSIKCGDVGVMEGMLPHLTMRFAGGKNSHYVTECLEMLQGLKREWPKDVSHFVRHHCWLVNSSGKRNGFTPVDRAQEARIKDIKVTHRSQGPSIDWDYLAKLHPALPVIQDVSHHVEQEFRTWTRYGRHTDPGDRQGILRLQEIYVHEGIHRTRAGRPFNTQANRVKDYYNDGLLNLAKPVERWVDGRTFQRATEESWEALSEGDGSEGYVATEASTSTENEESE